MWDYVHCLYVMLCKLVNNYKISYRQYTDNKPCSNKYNSHIYDIFTVQRSQMDDGQQENYDKMFDSFHSNQILDHSGPPLCSQAQKTFNAMS